MQPFLFTFTVAWAASASRGTIFNCGTLSNPPSLSDVNKFVETKFDYLIVGGGTAGVTLAARLSEDREVQVGIIEAGSFLLDNSIVDVPGNVGLGLGNPTFDWSFVSVPQMGTNGRNFSLPRGKMLGGSSGINGMAWNRASSLEYDVWNNFAPKSGWNWDGLLPFFKKSETVALNPRDPYPGITPKEALTASEDVPRVEGFVGPIKTSYNAFYFDVVSTWVEALNALGVKTNAEPQGGLATGVYNTHASIDRQHGVRSYSAIAYYCHLPPRDNLHILVGSQATKILLSEDFDDTSTLKATGVAYTVKSRHFVANVTREVILSAGTVQTPQLLELSGIGNSTLLGTHGIPALLDLPQVGENFQEHIFAPVQWKLEPGHETFDKLRNDATFSAEQSALYNTTRRGLLAAIDSSVSFHPLDTIVSHRTLLSLLEIYDRESNQTGLSPLQKIQYPIQRSLIEQGIVAHAELIEWSRGVFAPAANQSYVTVIGGLSHPTSRGTVHITTSDPFAPPAIDPRFLSSEFDALSLVEINKFVQRVGRTSPLADIISSQTNPDKSVQNDIDILNYVRSTAAGGDHLIGTAAMAPRENGGVVDSVLKVHGTANLRVVDASIIPLHIAAHTQATVYAIAEKAAEMIKSERSGAAIRLGQESEKSP